MVNRSEHDSATSVMIVDDHPVIRFGLRHMLGGHNDIVLVKDAEDIDGLIEAVRTAAPDVVILDLQLGDADGVEALRYLREVAPETRVLIYTVHVDDDYIRKVAALGVNGYLLKGCSRDEMVSAIRNVRRGGVVLDPSVAGRLMGQVTWRESLTSAPSFDPDKLSNREIEVLTCLAKGKSNRAIAESLYICETTVKFHVHTILSKLGAGNRTEAVAIAVQKGIISLEAHHSAARKPGLRCLAPGRFPVVPQGDGESGSPPRQPRHRRPR